jgi:N-acyl-D-amino-acid deacylase
MKAFAVGRWQLAVVFLLAGCATAPKPAPLDLKIVNARILDGTGAPWYRGSIGVRGDTIVSIGDLANASAAATIDAHDSIVSPGFIDLLGQSQNGVFADPYLEAKVRQGITTEVTGEGTSPGPSKRYPRLADYFDAVIKNGTALNFALFVGASNPREIVIGNVNRQPTADEMREMERIIDQAMREGAIGISTSLIYLPAMYSTTEEIVNLAKVAAGYGGVYFSHIRDEGERMDSALDEFFRIAREAKIPSNIWHMKASGPPSWGRMPYIVGRVNEARAQGLDIAGNVYPYAASSTGLSTLIPDWAMEGGYAEMKKRLADPAQRARIAEGLRAELAKRREKGVFVTRTGTETLAQYDKKFVEEIAAGMNLPPDEAVMRLFAETESSPGVIFFSMNEADVQTALRQPWVSIGADSGNPSPKARAEQTGVHPRAYGTFPRVVGHYVRDAHLFTLEEAVRKATSQAAARVNLHDRGILRPGMKADIIVFDPDKIRDVATFEDPHRFSEGISHVVVNGVSVLSDGVITKALPGRILRGRGWTGER